MKITKTLKNTIKMISSPTFAFVVATTMVEDALANTSSSGKAIEVEMVKNLGATAKAMLKGEGAFVIDAFILAGAAYAAIMAKSPAPMVFGIVTCGVFHIGVNLML